MQHNGAKMADKDKEIETLDQQKRDQQQGSGREKMPSALDPRFSVLGGAQTYASVTDKISSIVLARKTGKGWLLGFTISFVLLMVLLYTITYLVTTGIGIWGNNVPVAWAFDIINFVWWIGIGHAGTLISAILLLLRQD